MSSDQTEYELFISYARVDNRPIPETDPHGWVTALKEPILADHRQYSTAPLNIFFDEHEIRDMDDWRDRILGALRRSRSQPPAGLQAFCLTGMFRRVENNPSRVQRTWHCIRPVSPSRSLATSIRVALL